VKVSSNAKAVALRLKEQSKRTRADFGFLLGAAVETASANIAKKGVPTKEAVRPDSRYAIVSKRGRVKTGFSGTNPVNRTGSLKRLFQSFAGIAKKAEAYSKIGDGMAMTITTRATSLFRREVRLLWRSNAAKIGALENREVTDSARAIGTGKRPLDWAPSRFVGKKRRFISRRFAPVIRQMRIALGSYSPKKRLPKLPPISTE
jgi:hypothetical protein